MSIHNLCFTVKIRKMYTPVHPRFTMLKWGVRGYTSHGHVILMLQVIFQKTRLFKVSVQPPIFRNSKC